MASRRRDSRLDILAIDPGGTTGWAVIKFPPSALLRRSGGEPFDCEYGQLTGDANSQVNEIVGELIPGLRGPLIMEDFILRKFSMSRDLLAPLQIIYKMEYILWLDGGVIPYKKQQPSLAMSTMTDARLRDVGLWVEGMPHARDAIRHALTFARRAKTDRRLVRWAWPDLDPDDHP